MTEATTIVKIQADVQSMEWKAMGIAAKIASGTFDIFQGAEAIAHLVIDEKEKKDA